MLLGGMDGRGLGDVLLFVLFLTLCSKVNCLRKTSLWGGMAASWVLFQGEGGGGGIVEAGGGRQRASFEAVFFVAVLKI